MPVAASSRVVLYGATGFTGELTAREMARRGMRPVLAGRAPKRLEKLAAELGGLEVAVADVTEPRTVKALVERGRRARHDRRAVRALGRAGADGGADEASPLPRRDRREHVHPPRVRVRRAARQARGRRAADGDGLRLGAGQPRGSARAARGGRRMRGACGSATSSTPRPAATASRARSAAARARSAAGAMLDSGFAFRGGKLVDERPARRVSSFETHDGRREPAISVASSEHFTLPRIAPGLDEVDVYLGWFGAASRPLQALTRQRGADRPAARARKARSGAVAPRFVKGSTRRPAGGLARPRALARDRGAPRLRRQ